jgi:uncharacterized phage-like protein YoqJ
MIIASPTMTIKKAFELSVFMNKQLKVVWVKKKMRVVFV